MNTWHLADNSDGAKLESSYQGFEVQLLCTLECNRQESLIMHASNVRCLEMLEIFDEALHCSHTYVQSLDTTNMCDFVAMPFGSKIESCLMADHVDKHQTRSAVPLKL